ncbi:MAG: C4-type zinc ribbon domain-containing protein [Algisphaera sp.]
MDVQDLLRSLFLVDRQLQALRSRVDAAARRLSAVQTRLDQHERQHAELSEQLKTVQTHVATQENEAASVEARIEKLRETMSAVKNNKEYSALLVEVNTLKTQKGKYEEIALGEMGKVDELQDRLKLLTGKTDDQRVLVENAQKEVTQGESEISDQLTELQTQREAAAAPINDATMNLYTKLINEFDGVALAEIEEQDRKRMEYTCGECYMALPIQVVNATLTATDAPVICSSCQRILYATAELKEALAPSEKKK